MDHGWGLLLDLVSVLTGAVVLGVFLERIRQSAVIGYILAGVILGPSALGLISDPARVGLIAEAGVALLLFTIGLEFSFAKLRAMGWSALGPALFQILTTGLVVAGICMAMGFKPGPAVALGAIIALSSTAIVMRILKDTGALDAVHGRASIGVLLVQDAALVPLVLLFAFLSPAGAQVAQDFSFASLGLGVVVVLASYIVLTRLVPRAFLSSVMGRNRELPILLSILICMAAAYVAHTLGVSPSLGAFLAGMLLAETSFSEQLRVDVAPLRTLFVTIFFTSVGLLADVRWVAANLLLVLGLVVAVLLVKTAVAFVGFRLFRQTIVHSLAAGICISQVGELSFVLGQLGASKGVLDSGTLQAVNSVAIITLVLSPLLVASAPRAARSLAKRLFRLRTLAKDTRERSPQPKLSGHTVVAGLGEAGVAFVEALSELPGQMVLIDVNPKTVHDWRTKGFEAHLGDATNPETLIHAGIANADLFVVAVSDHESARLAVVGAKQVNPEIHVVARARYHRFAAAIDAAGATVVVDEERRVGEELAREALRCRQATL